MATDTEMALHVHADHFVPVFLAQTHEHAVAADSGIVHDHVEIAECADRRLHDVARIRVTGDVARIGDRLAAERLDIGNRALGRLQVDVVHHHARAFPRELQRVFAPQSAACAGDDHDAPVTNSCHLSISKLVFRLLGCELRHASRGVDFRSERACVAEIVGNNFSDAGSRRTWTCQAAVARAGVDSPRSPPE